MNVLDVEGVNALAPWTSRLRKTSTGRSASVAENVRRCARQRRFRQNFVNNPIWYNLRGERNDKWTRAYFVFLRRSREHCRCTKSSSGRFSRRSGTWMSKYKKHKSRLPTNWTRGKRRDISSRSFPLPPCARRRNGRRIISRSRSG